jgi:hypothetical protein
MMLVLFVNKKEVSHDYRGVGYHVFFAKYTIYLKFILYICYIFNKKNPNFL